MTMTTYEASARPSAEDVVSVLKELHAQVNPTKRIKDVNPSLRLLQALNDKSKSTIDRSMAPTGLKDWLNDNVNLKRLENPAVDVAVCEQITCLTFASWFNDIRTVRQLVKVGCDVAAKDLFGQTPLHWACGSGVDAKSKAVFLLRCEASLVNASDYRNCAPLYCAARAGNSDVVKKLLGHGADVHARGRFGRTALLYTSRKGHVDCVEYLLQQGANIEAQDDNGSTALGLAAHFGHAEIIELLLNYT